MECVDELREVNRAKSTLDEDIAECQKNLVKQSEAVKVVGVQSNKLQKEFSDLEGDFKRQVEIAGNAVNELSVCSQELRNCQTSCSNTHVEPPVVDQSQTQRLNDKIKELERQLADRPINATCDSEALDEDEKFFKDAFDDEFYFRSY